MNQNQNLVKRPPLPAELRAQRDFILLDGSGSMLDSWWPMMDAIQGYVDTLIRNGTQSYGTLTVFSGPDLDMVQRDGPISEWQSLIQFPAESTWGGTPLYDAINCMARRLRDEDPARCAITIVTDGDSNGRQATSKVQARAILDWCRAKGWEVTFIGCDWDNEAMARELGSHPSAAIGVSKALLRDAAESLARKRSAYGSTGAPMHWSEEERSQFGGYLGHSGSGT